MMSLEWHLAAAYVLTLGVLHWSWAIVSASMWCVTLSMAVHSSLKAPLPRKAHWWSRPLVGMLYVLQPIVRGWHRQTHLLRSSRLPRLNGEARQIARKQVKRISAREQDLYFSSEDARGRVELLTALVEEGAKCDWRGDFDDAWSTYDVKLVGDRWHDVRVRTATEELGWPSRFTRARCLVRPTLFNSVACGATTAWSLAAVVSMQPWPQIAALGALVGLFWTNRRSRQRCFSAVTTLVARAGMQAKLRPMSASGEHLDEAVADELPDTGEPCGAGLKSKVPAGRALEESAAHRTAVTVPRQ